MNVSKLVCGIVLVLLWSWIIGKTIKTLAFHDNTHLPDQSRRDASCRGVLTLFRMEGQKGTPLEGVIRGKRKRDPGTLQTRDQNLPK